MMARDIAAAAAAVIAVSPAADSLVPSHRKQLQVLHQAWFPRQFFGPQCCVMLLLFVAGALFYSLYSHSNSSYTAAGAVSRMSSMTKASDMRHWQAKMLQHQQHLLLQQQQQIAAAAAVGCENSSSSLSRQSSCIPAVHSLPAMLSHSKGHSVYLQQQQQQQQQQGVYRQLTISAADIEAPILPDQQPLQQSPSPLQGLRSVSSPAAAAAAVVPPLLLPAVTLMFVSVDGSKVLRKHHVREVHCQLSLMFMEALRHVPGGYMCRMQVCAAACTSAPACALL
jgi:hypothetical protein